MLTDTTRSPYARLAGVPFGKVHWCEGALWHERLQTCAQVTVPQLRELFEDESISHVVQNFRVAANLAEGGFDGTPFGDGDFYKWMEAAIYTAGQNNDEAALAAVDEYIALVAAAQQPDGYISTKQIIGEREAGGVQRQSDINDFEVYNLGHLFTAACLHKRVTGKDSFIEVADRAAAYLSDLYHRAKQTGEVKTAVCPSHYMGLVELYRTTRDEKYLRLAALSLELRDSVENGLDDNQDRLPLKEHERIIGHAVRANYLYAGVADLYAETGDEEYLALLHRMWRSLMDSKVYITGGCGALYNGASPYGNFWMDQKVHQAYGYEYQLPNITAYNETCASLGAVFWAYRMFLLEPKAEYFDFIERAMLNVNLAAISMDGKRFFYENMLRRADALPYELCWPLERKEYISSFCCPPNLTRTLAQTGEYAYLTDKNGVWTGLYGASEAKLALENGARFTLKQETQYPWDGRLRFTFADVENATPFTLHLRVPGWAASGMLCVNGSEQALGAENAGTYLAVDIADAAGTTVELVLDMPVRYTAAHPLVEEATNQVAVERGPLVYCVEGADMPGGTLDGLLLDIERDFVAEPLQIEGREVVALRGEALRRPGAGAEKDSLYHTVQPVPMQAVPLRMVPYFAWDNRGFGEMKVWLPAVYRV